METQGETSFSLERCSKDHTDLGSLARWGRCNRDLQGLGAKNIASIPVIKSLGVGFLKKMEAEKDAIPCCEKY
jgi:hypothetical protein